MRAVYALYIVALGDTFAALGVCVHAMNSVIL